MRALNHNPNAGATLESHSAPTLYAPLKRTMELLITVVLILLLLPLLATIAALIRLEDQGSVIFVQKRLGRGAIPVEILKFRSMTDEYRDPSIQVVGGSDGTTRVGRVIRRFKLDELPQLWNVVRGDLSLIGPRPCLPETDALFGEASAKRHAVRPGLTGLSQVKGNIHLSWEERLELDLEYVDCQSLSLDLSIMVRTVAVVVFGDKWGAGDQ